MVDPLLLLSVALVASLFMSWSVGANSNSAPIAPAVGANALSVLRGALLVGIVASLGAVAQGGSISHTIGTGLIDGTHITTTAAAAALLTAASFIAVGVRTGYPIPAAFTVTGAVIGVGLALGGSLALVTYGRILAFWFSIPIVEGGLAFATAYLLVRTDVPDAVTVPGLAAVVGFVVANVRLTLLPSPDGGPATLARTIAESVSLPVRSLLGTFTVGTLAVSVVFAAIAGGLVYVMVSGSETRGIRQFLVGLGLLVTFTSGGSQVGLATGPLETVATSEFGVPGLALLGLGGFGILLGAWTGAPRLIQAVSNEYAAMGPYRSIAALVPAFLVAQVAITLGIPISFNKVMVSSIVGSGWIEGSGSVSGAKTGYTVAAWVGSMAGAAAVSFALYHVLTVALGGG
ncbi:inorganic phosphate transporter [Halorussus ruber]|uniref:inorganic phosphate transporter n=1 Tax=Halorussus ruber TaxID=1126238 RepID=UPI0010925E55|nr:inorganic phosphate transporter [Halorussus ruber]